MKFEKLTVKTLDRQGIPTAIGKYEDGTIEFKEGFAFVDYIGLYDKESVVVYSGTCWFDLVPIKEKEE